MNRLIEALRELPAPSPYRYAVRVAGLALAYFLAARIGLEYAVAYPVISTVWPASGIALAAVLLGGLRLLPAVFIGAFAVNYSIEGAITVSAIAGLGNSLEALLGTLLLRRVLDFDVRVSRLRDVVFLIVVAATIAPLPAALLGPLGLALFGGLAWPELIHAFRVWWMGDSLGIVLIAPLLLTWAARPALDWGSPRFWYVTILLAIQFAVCYAVFGGFLIDDFGLSRVTYFVLPFAVWIALAHDIRFIALANAGLFAIAVWGTANGTGPFAGVSVEIDLILLHIFLVVYSITTLLVAAVNGERNRAVANADDTAERFRSLSELSSDWYWAQDQSLRFTSISGSTNDRAGLSGSQSFGKTRFELPNEFESEEVRRRHAADLNARRPFRDLVLKRYRQDGQVHYALISGQPIFESQGTFKGYRGVGRDITALKLAESALRENEERLRLQFQDMPIACIILDKSLLITDWNPAAERIFGFTKAEVIGRSPYDLVIPESARADVAGRIRDLQQGSSSDGFNESITKSGDTIICKWHSTVLSNAAGEVRGYMAMAEDVNAMVRAERTIRESEERFRSLTELSNDWYWEQDEHYRNTYMSPRYSARNGMAMKSTLGQTRFETDNIWESEEVKREHRKVLDAHLPFRDLQLARGDVNGELHYMLISGRPVFDSGGKFTGYRGVGKDITAQKTAEIRVARLRDFYAALSEVNNAIIHAQDRSQLFAEVCKAVVEHGRLQFVRIAMLEPLNREVRTVAHSGNDHGLSARFYFSMDPSVPEGRVPSARALREGGYFICNDVAEDTDGILGRELLLAAGLRSVATFPLPVGGAPAGALQLYATEPGFFDDELVNLIDKLAQNVSFALNNFEREAARRAAEKALRDSEQRFRDIAQAAGEYVWENDNAGRYTYLSPRVVEVLGFNAEELVGHSATEFMPAEEPERVRQWFADNMKPDRSFRGLEHMIISKSGETLWLHVSGVATRDERGNPTGHRGTARDVTEIKESEARISYLATRDPLTELPNRLLFNDRLEQGIINARRKGDSLAVLFIDLDRFKNINDSLGHHVGDLLLREVSSQMAACIRKGDTLSRLGGDEFVVTLEGLSQAEDAAQVARKIIRALAKPLNVGGHMLNTTCSIGISIYPNDAEDGRELMKNADTAMYHAKERGRNNFQFFSPEMNVRAVERHQLETEMRRALDLNQLVLHYQPQADMRTGTLVGMEALIRWQHPERGLVPPSSFIPVAEESGLIELIGRWALKTACEQNREWQASGLPALKVAVNISTRQFNDPRGFANEVTRLLNATGLDPRYLELELTESMLLKNVDENIAVLRRLGKLGTHLAVDDFGTGYSSLAYLKQLPIATLKIDRTFVRDIETDSDDAAIIEAIIAMAHGLDVRVTAEGVETKGQMEALRKLGCDEFQGYLLSKPLPAADFAAQFLAPAKKKVRRVAASALARASRGRARRA